MRRLVVLASLVCTACGNGFSDIGSGGDTQNVGFESGVAYVSAGDIYVADARDYASRVQRLTQGGGNSQPALRRDGRAVAYVFTDSSGAQTLFTVPSSGGTPATLVPAAARHVAGLAWSPDGSRLYFAADHALYAVNADGSGLGQVGPSSGDFHSPSVARDGSLWALDGFSGSAVRISGNVATPFFSVPDAAHAVISPDGQHLAYDDSSSGEIFVLDAPGASPRQVTSIPGSFQSQPAWSTDGASLFFTSNAGGSNKIYRISASASGSSGTLVQVGSEPSYGG